MVTIATYRPTWAQEFQAQAKWLRYHLGPLAMRIDHIGSTSVPGLSAKNIIDIQITAARLEDALEHKMNAAGFDRNVNILQDHVPAGREDTREVWGKWFFRSNAAGRKVNVHVRLPGSANQRYALLFRDYLRALPAVAQAYGQVKQAIILHHPEPDMEVYYDIKDPVCDIIMGGAEAWAQLTGWKLGPSDG